MPRSRHLSSNYSQGRLVVAEPTTGFTDKALCDDCGKGAQIVVSELITRGVDILCWECMMARAIAVAATVVEAAEKADQDATGM